MQEFNIIMDAVRTVSDLVIQESDIIKTITNGLSDTNQRIEKHYDELKLFNNDMTIRFVKTEEQLKTIKLLMIGGFVMLFTTMSYIINRLDQLTHK